MHSTCTGIVVRAEQSFASATIATSASLLRNFGEERFIDIIPNLTIKVRLPNNQVVPACLHHYDLERYIIFLATKELSPDHLCAARLDHGQQLEPSDELTAVRRCFKSGKLMATYGAPIDSSSEVYDVYRPSEDHDKELMFSTCKITAAGTGGPLVDRDWNIVGMNFFGGETTPFLPSNRILQCLGPDLRAMVQSYQQGRRTRQRTPDEEQKTPMPCRRHAKEPLCERAVLWFRQNLQEALRPWGPSAFTDKVNETLEADGYPLPIYFDYGMQLIGTFEEPFGKDMWTEPTKRVASKMSPTVVSLASFNGNARFFVCTGVFIDCNGHMTRVLTSASLFRTSGDKNKLDHNLRIEVCLPSKQRVTGTLEHYNLCYNVAIVSIMSSPRHRVAKLDESLGSRRYCTRRHRTEELDESPMTRVVALGRGFESGKLMATCGVVTDKVVTDEPGNFDCKELLFSTCKITKAGIGGPLVNFDGSFIGMNFYDTEETPYLPRDIILEVLRHFDAKRNVVDGTMEGCTYSWCVPDAYWYYPSLYYVPKEYEEEERVLE